MLGGLRRRIRHVKASIADRAPSLAWLSRARGEADGLFGGADEGARLVARLLVLGLGIAVGDDAAAGLDEHRAVLHHRGAQGDAGIHGAVRGEIADSTPIDA